MNPIGSIECYFISAVRKLRPNFSRCCQISWQAMLMSSANNGVDEDELADRAVKSSHCHWHTDDSHRRNAMQAIGTPVVNQWKHIGKKRAMRRRTVYSDKSLGFNRLRL
jgi:hypothetical protein